MPLKLMYITNQPDIALLAEQNGVDWVFVDLELNGKEERQGHLDTVISRHAIRDVSRLRAVLKHAELLVRVNPIFQGSRYEINEVINRGADVVMLPYYKTVDEVETFIELVDKRAKVCLLCETKEAVACMPEVLKLTGIDYIVIGLNDLHLSYGQSFLFEPLTDGTIEAIVRQMQAAGIPYGFGGIARESGKGDSRPRRCSGSTSDSARRSLSCRAAFAISGRPEYLTPNRHKCSKKGYGKLGCTSNSSNTRHRSGWN